jgi:hypothetical protein
MKNRFMIAVDGLSSSAETDFVQFLRENGLGWWHRLPNFWLITDRKQKVTAKLLRDKIKELRTEPSKGCLVMQVNEDITWAGLYAIGSQGRDEFDWLKKTWKDE